MAVRQQDVLIHSNNYNSAARAPHEHRNTTRACLIRRLNVNTTHTHGSRYSIYGTPASHRPLIATHHLSAVEPLSVHALHIYTHSQSKAAAAAANSACGANVLHVIFRVSELMNCVRVDGAPMSCESSTHMLHIHVRVRVRLP